MTEALPITVYWRPGCMFCRSLMRGLERAGVETVDVNIWEAEGAQDLVRAAARGNETVPTVEVGGRWLVNPSVREVMAAAGLLVDDGRARRRRFPRP